MFLEWLKKLHQLLRLIEKPVVFWNNYFLHKEKCVVCRPSQKHGTNDCLAVSSFCKCLSHWTVLLFSGLLLCLFELMTIIVFLKVSCFNNRDICFCSTLVDSVWGWNYLPQIDLYSSVYWQTGLILDDGDLGGSGKCSRCLGVSPTLPAASSKFLL